MAIVLPEAHYCAKTNTNFSCDRSIKSPIDIRITYEPVKWMFGGQKRNFSGLNSELLSIRLSLGYSMDFILSVFLAFLRNIRLKYGYIELSKSKLMKMPATTGFLMPVVVIRND